MSLAIDVLCLLSGIGIYPRFVEPKLLIEKHLRIELPKKELDGLKIVQISDLHFHKKLSSHFLKRITKKIRKIKPDLIVFTGDFICYSRLEDEKRLEEFLNSLQAPLGAYCTFGNHDYAKYVSRNAHGDYDVLSPASPFNALFKGIKTIFQKEGISRRGIVMPLASQVGLHTALTHLLKQTPFKLLENETVTLPVGLNIVGLGDYALNRFKPESAFKNYDKTLPGLILSHNPDTAPMLTGYPGDLILSGHSHGEQIYLPGPKFLRKISQKLTRLENPNLSRGLHKLEKKTLYVNRGLGCHKAIRLFSPPEITVITVKGTPS